MAMVAGYDRRDDGPPRPSLDEPELPASDLRGRARPLATRERPSTASARPLDEREVAPDPEAGDEVGPYTLLQALGRGGAGTVFKARHRADGGIVALKVLAASKVKRARIVQRFFDEVRAASSVDHPGLVEVYDFIEEDQPRRLAYAMEYVDGESLRQRLRREGALALRTAIAVGLQVCDALTALHDVGIIHRDLKPENILLVTEDDRVKVKLLDFGVVKFLPVDRSVRSDTSSPGTFVGTPRYMAPEQAAGAAVDHRADLFALGVMLFEMITGHCPHEGDSLRDVVLAKLKGAPRITVNPEQEILPQELTDVVDACLQLKPSLRPSSASKVRTGLAEAELVLFAVGRPVRVPALLSEDDDTVHSLPIEADTPPPVLEPALPPPPLPTILPRTAGRRIAEPWSPVRYAVVAVAIIATAVALAVGARLLTQEDAVLVLPEPDPPSLAKP